MMLHAAVGQKNFDIISYLVRSGHDINSTDNNGFTPLHIATRNKFNNLAYALICWRADINIRDHLGNIPVFYYSADSGDLNTFLRFRGTARVNPILLRITAQVRDIKIVEVLLQRRSLSIDTPDIHGQTAIYFTAYREPFSANKSKNEIPFREGVEVDIAKMLLDKGSKVNVKTFKGFTTLHAAIENGYFKLVNTLLEHDANVNSKTDINETPLHVSVRNNFGPICQCLLSRGADVNATLTYFQITPLHIAAYNRNEKIAELLLRFGAKLDCKTQFDLTPLHIATIVGSLKVVKLLLRFGVDMDAKDEFGRTALHIASKNRYETIISALLNHGADINIINSDNCTPFDYAKVGKHLTTINYDPEGNLCTLENTIMTLELHVLKMRALNLFVNEKILKFVDSEGDMGHVKDECDAEIRNMKSEKIVKSVSFYDILTKNTLARIVRYENIARVLKSQEYKTKFPRYADMIEINLTNRKRRISLLNQIDSFGYGLPYNCLDNILSYLHNGHLEILVKAYNPIDDEEISSNMFEKMRYQDRTLKMVQSIRNSISYFTRQKKELSLKYFGCKIGPIYLAEVFLMFAYFERICLYKCDCTYRKCYSLHTVT